MKRVLMIAYHYPPEGSSSGVLRTLKFSKYLGQHGWRPHVLTLRETAYRVRDWSLAAQVPAEVTVHRTRGCDLAARLSIRGRYPAVVAWPDRFVSWYPFGVASGLRVARRAALHALYSTSPHPTAHLIAATLGALIGVPWVADFRDPWIEDGAYPQPGSLRWVFESRLERMVVRQADRITVTTQHFRQALLDRYPALPGTKVGVLHNGYDEDDFAGIQSAATGERFEILHAGLLTPEYRDPRPVLEAVAQLIASGLASREHVRVVFMGGGPYPESAAFRGLVARLGLDGVVEATGRRPYRETLERVSRASVLLLLQASEDTRALIPAKAFEYLRARRPVLAVTLEGATADLVRSAHAGVVVSPEDVGAMQDALAKLYRRRADGDAQMVDETVVARYERRRVTGELAALLNGLERRGAVR